MLNCTSCMLVRIFRNLLRFTLLAVAWYPQVHASKSARTRSCHIIKFAFACYVNPCGFLVVSIEGAQWVVILRWTILKRRLIFDRVMSPSTTRWYPMATLLQALCRVGFYIKLGPTWPASDLRLGLANGLFTKPRVVTMVPSWLKLWVEESSLLRKGSRW